MYHLLLGLITKTDKEIAKEIGGITPAEIGRWRRGENQPTKKDQPKVFDYIQLIIDELTRIKNTM